MEMEQGAMQTQRIPFQSRLEQTHNCKFLNFFEFEFDLFARIILQ